MITCNNYYILTNLDFEGMKKIISLDCRQYYLYFTEITPRQTPIHNIQNTARCHIAACRFHKNINNILIYNKNKLCTFVHKIK